MDSLCNPRSLSNWYKAVLIPLSFYGLGSIESLLNLKMIELTELKSMIGDEDIRKLYMSLHGLA